MATTREMLDEAGLGCGASGTSVQVGIDAPGSTVQVGTDAYEDLRNATPEELLEAVIWFTSQGVNDLWQLKRTLSSLRRGFALAQPDGWQHVALHWLRESRKIAALDMKEKGS